MSKVMHSLKSYTANQANKMLGRTGPLYQPEYFDRWIRDEDHLRNARNYIHQNPVKAGLCRTPEAWPFCSAALRIAGW
jgi:putative DNA methylase